MALLAQVLLALFLAAVVAVLWGLHPGVSSALGGLVAAVGTLVLGVFARLPTRSARDVLRLALRAEALRVLLMLGLLGLAVALYPGLVLVACVAGFAVSLLLSRLAFIVAENEL